MEKYVDEMKNQFSIHYNAQIIEVMPHTDVVQDFIEKLGHFYEIVEEKPLLPKKITNGSVPLENGHLEDLPTKTEPDTDISTGESDTPSSDINSVEHLPDLNTAEIEESAAHSTPLTGSPAGGNDQMNGYHDDSSDGEEFCDTSDSPENRSDSTALDGSGEGQYEHIPSMEELQTRVKSIGGPGPDHNDNELANGEPSRSNGHDHVGRTDVTDAMMTRGGGETQRGEVGDRNLQRSGSAGGQTGQGRGPAVPGGSRTGRSHFVTSGGAGGGGREQGRGQAPNTDMSEQISVALIRLQQDMNSVLTRLNTLETLTLAQNQLQRGREESPERSRRNRVNPWWWPFPNVNSRTVFFIVVWPFIVNWVITFIARRRRARRR